MRQGPPRGRIIKCLHFGDARTMISLQITPRVSTCGLCQQSILKGHLRMTFMHTYAKPRQPAKSKGTIYQRKTFYHPHCFAEWLGSPTQTNDHHASYCVDCEAMIYSERMSAYLHRRSAPVSICTSCAHSKRWRYCRFCGYFVIRYRASEIINDPTIPAGHFACDYCQTEQGCDTIKTGKRSRREKREIERTRSLTP